MEIQIKIVNSYLCLPISLGDGDAHSHSQEKLEIYMENEKLHEFQVSVYLGEGSYPWDYLAYIRVEGWKGKRLLLRGNFPPSFFENIGQRDEDQEPALPRPKIHFTATRGWINDPNGLVCQDGIYHMYFQYNPFHVEWGNMCWGSAVSRDLVHWTQKDVALWPDAQGTVFSGSAIINSQGLLGLGKDALVYFYTAAGGTNDWSKGKGFTQRLAYSLDGGRTLVKWPEPILVTDCKESRDPKVFWHQESGAYVMVLWLKDNDFGIYRSNDLLHWDNTQVLELPGAWECPDLVELEVEGGGRQWVFYSADGYYFPGKFDGHSFARTGDRGCAFGTKLPYAAQTWSGAKGRSIAIFWLRTSHTGKPYAGSMAFPKELSWARGPFGEGIRLRQARELEACKRPVPIKEGGLGRWLWDYGFGQAFELQVQWVEGNGRIGPAAISLPGQNLFIDPAMGTITYEGQAYASKMPIRQATILVDQGIVEIMANDGIIYLAYESKTYDLRGQVALEGQGVERAALGWIC